MSQGETIISILLVFIAYFLYQIAKQLSYLTGKRLKNPFKWQGGGSFRKAKTKKPDEPIEKLPN